MSESKKSSSGSTQELLARIRELELENMELKSKLDQYQSIFEPAGNAAASTGGSGGGAAAGTDKRARRVNRGVGISAEPQSLRSLKDITAQTFPEFKKSER